MCACRKKQEVCRICIVSSLIAAIATASDDLDGQVQQLSTCSRTPLMAQAIVFLHFRLSCRTSVGT